MSRRTPAEVRYFGICHHSPLCSKSLLLALDQYDPDRVLVEGPPEATALLTWIGHAELIPPVAILTYAPAHPSRSVLYPLAEFSPEWQALLWARRRGKQVAFIDCPHRFRLAGTGQRHEARFATGPLEPFLRDAVEACEPSESYFAELVRLTAELRQQGTVPQRELRREAWMRHLIDEQRRQTAGRIAVVCGAWHVPALPEGSLGLPERRRQRVRVKALWVPFSYDALRQSAAYAAGVLDPPWADHLWRTAAASRTSSWFLIHGAHDPSSGRQPLASVITATDLATTLADMRGLAQPGPEELRLSWTAVGSPLRHSDAEQKTGTVPVTLAQTPLLDDFRRRMRELGLPEQTAVSRLHLSTNHPRDRDLSELFHLSVLLGLPLTVRTCHQTYKGWRYELWEYSWTPGIPTKLVRLSHLGNRCEAVAEALALAQARKVSDPVAAAVLLRHASAAGLDRVGWTLLRKFDRARAGSSLPVLLTQLTAMVEGEGEDHHPVVGYCRRLLATARRKAGQDGTALTNHSDTLIAAHRAMSQRSDALLDSWLQFLRALATCRFAGQVAGLACRLLLEAGACPRNAFVHLVPTLRGRKVEDALAWWGGFLRGSLGPLMTSRLCRDVLHRWITSLSERQFQAWLPLLRQALGAAPLAQRLRVLESLDAALEANQPFAGLVTNEAEQTLRLLWRSYEH